MLGSNCIKQKRLGMSNDMKKFMSPMSPIHVYHVLCVYIVVKDFFNLTNLPNEKTKPDATESLLKSNI